MNKIVITTDSACNPKNINNMIPCMIMDKNNKKYYDIKVTNEIDNNKEIDYKLVFERANKNELFQRVPSKISNYMDIIGKYLDNDYEVIHLSSNSNIVPGCLNISECIYDVLTEEYNETKISIIDTKNIGVGASLINDYANSLLEKDLDKKEIINRLEALKNNIVSTYYTPRIYKFLQSGVVSQKVSLPTMLSLGYRLDVNKNGALENKRIYTGNKEEQFMKYLANIINKSNINTYDPNFISILTTKLNTINKDKIKDYIDGFNYFNTDIEINDFYGVMSSFGQEDFVGIGLIKKID